MSKLKDQQNSKLSRSGSIIKEKEMLTLNQSLSCCHVLKGQYFFVCQVGVHCLSGSSSLSIRQQFIVVKQEFIVRQVGVHCLSGRSTLSVSQQCIVCQLAVHCPSGKTSLSVMQQKIVCQEQCIVCQETVLCLSSNSSNSSLSVRQQLQRMPQRRLIYNEDLKLFLMFF